MKVILDEKAIAWGILTLFLLGAGLPMGTYWSGLENTIGRPAPPKSLTFSRTSAAAVWRQRQEAFPIALRPIAPWHFQELLWCSRGDYSLEDFLACDGKYPGLGASAYVAKDYLKGKMKRDGLVWRYLSRLALAIWISRNWSVQELVAELIRIEG